ncbi:MAG: hypothetical protein Q8N98_01210, partial [bacterium]|nr:hypothetical protein [bacterium]
MKIYYGTSPRTKERYGKEALAIYETLKKLGYELTSDFVAKVDPKKFYSQSTAEFNLHHKDTLGA